MHSRNFFLVLAVLVSTVLAGCSSWVPGHRMEAETKLETGKADNGIQVELIPITPQLIMEQDKARPVPTIPPELLATEPATYRIGPGDVLYITVWDHPELTTPSGSQQQIFANGRNVHTDGTLFYPHVGIVKVAGMTLQELGAKLTQDLSKYIENPQMDVSVISFESQKALLSGAFRSTLPIRITTTPISLIEAIGSAGVITEEADLSKVILIRNGHQYVLDVYGLTRQSTEINQVYLQDKDRIHMSYNDEKKVFVMGEVTQPMSLAFHANTVSLSNVLGSAGGLDKMSANGNAVYIIRGMDDLEKEPAKIFQLNTRSASGFVLASRFQLEPKDVVYVGATGITYWNRLISELIPTATLLKLGTSLSLDVKQIENLY